MSSPSLRLRYFANVRFPSERANSIQIVSMCSAFAASGAKVELLHPRRYNRFVSSASSLFEHYGVPENFGTKKIFSLDFIDRLPRSWQHPAFRLQSFTFGMRAILEMIKGGPSVFYLRDNATLALAAALLPRGKRQRLFYEAHDFPKQARSAGALTRAASRCGGVIAITRGLQERFEEAGLPGDRLLLAPDGVDLERFKDLPSREEARASLSLPKETPIAVYTGQFFPWKGVDTLVSAAAWLPEWKTVLVGGREEDRRRLEETARSAGVSSRIVFTGQVPPGRVPLYLRAADILVLPNSGRYPISARYTSPMKLFEYMAARRPIVASDLPSLREVLRHEENALLVPPDDAEALAIALSRLLTDQDQQDRLASNAARDVTPFEWRQRARGILAFITSTKKGEETP